MIRNFVLVLLAPAFIAGAVASQDPGAPFTIRAEKLYVGDGTVIAPALVTIEGGRITSVGPAPSGARSDSAFAVENACVTPGFVEGTSSVGLPRGAGENEEKSEVTPCARVSSVLDASDEGFRRMREAGVTTLIVSPGNRNVVGGLSVAVKPREGTARQLVLQEDVALHAVLGLEPAFRNQSPRNGSQTLFARRPNSRMGVIFELRRAFQEGCERNGIGTRGKSCFCDADGALLGKVMKGEIPLAMVAHAEQDILTALNIADEFGAKNFWLEGAVEAWLQRDLLARRGIPVLIGPVYHSSQIPEGAEADAAAGGPLRSDSRTRAASSGGPSCSRTPA